MVLHPTVRLSPLKLLTVSVFLFFGCGKVHILCYSNVYLSFNGEVIPNHGYVEISDIGCSDTTALLCHTNRPDDVYTSVGHWFAPDWTNRVESVWAVPGFERNRSPMLVKLIRNSGAPDEGIYRDTSNSTCSTLEEVLSNIVSKFALSHTSSFHNSLLYQCSLHNYLRLDYNIKS